MLQTFGRYDFGRDGGNAARGALNKQKGRVAVPSGRIPVKSVRSLPFDPLTYAQCRRVVRGELAPFAVGNPFESLVDLDKRNAMIYLRAHRREALIASGKRQLPISEPALQ